MFGFVPIRIDWEGHVDVDEDDGCSVIKWDTTSLRLGWGHRWLGKTFKEPQAAEVLRKVAWEIYFPGETAGGGGPASGDVVVFHRRGRGKLVYARDECLCKPS